MSSLAYSGLGLSYTYGYDTLGNITSVVKNGSTEATYAYDLQNQLVSETVGGNTYAYNYDTVGNLMSVQKNGSTIKSYTYGDSAWADLLTAFTVNGITGSITYDNVGNPLAYYNGTSYAMTWTPERRLATLTGGGKTISYAYDMDGIRTSKTVNGTTTSYTTVSGQVVRETTGSTVIDFAYEDTGAPYAMRYNGSIYYYLLNLQGDVVGLVDASGNTVASYSYDAWGNVLSATGSLAAINPLRYRGYYYDSETGLYYVSSRYYDPEIGRWINADGVMSDVGGDIRGYNLFAYCMNNPVNMSDHTGNWPSWATKLVAAVAVVAVVAAVAAITVATAGAGTAAAVIAVGAAKGAAIGLVTGAAIGAGTAAVNHRVSTGSWEGADKAALEGAGDGALSGAITGAVTGAASGATKVAQAAKAWDSGTFKSGYQSMKYHYNKHVVSEGLTKGNNVLKYTQDAVNFANRNSSVLKYTYNYNYGNASWNLTYSTGQGGMFTSAGKILTFWYR